MDIDDPFITPTLGKTKALWKKYGTMDADEDDVEEKGAIIGNVSTISITINPNDDSFHQLITNFNNWRGLIGKAGKDAVELLFNGEDLTQKQKAKIVKKALGSGSTFAKGDIGRPWMHRKKDWDVDPNKRYVSLDFFVSELWLMLSLEMLSFKADTSSFGSPLQFTPGRVERRLDLLDQA